jgi:hypothetical protein
MFANPTSISRRRVHRRPPAAPLSRPSRFVLARSFKTYAFATRSQNIWALSPALSRGCKMLKTQTLKMAAQLPSQADKGRRALARRRSRLRAAPIARRHGSRSSFAPNIRSVAAASVPQCGRRGRRPLQLRVITLARPRELRAITDASIAIVPSVTSAIISLSRASRSPTQRRKVRNGPRPAKRATAEATLRALDS